MLLQIPFVPVVQSRQAGDSVRLVPSEAKRTALLDDNSPQEEAKEGEAVAWGDVGRVRRDYGVEEGSWAGQDRDQEV